MEHLSARPLNGGIGGTDWATRMQTSSPSENNLDVGNGSGSEMSENILESPVMSEEMTGGRSETEQETNKANFSEHRVNLEQSGVNWGSIPIPHEGGGAVTSINLPSDERKSAVITQGPQISTREAFHEEIPGSYDDEGDESYGDDDYEDDEFEELEGFGSGCTGEDGGQSTEQLRESVQSTQKGNSSGELARAAESRASAPPSNAASCQSASAEADEPGTCRGPPLLRGGTAGLSHSADEGVAVPEESEEDAERWEGRVSPDLRPGGTTSEACKSPPR
ncbi:unnamed protein product, partial [Discosporangium mesarthrocarpum]